MDWQPIETAPKDGTVVIVRGFYDADGEVSIKAAAAQYSKRWMMDNDGYGFTVSLWIYGFMLPNPLDAVTRTT